MTEYFTTSEALSELPSSLSYFLSLDATGLPFVVSPNLDAHDIDAIRRAIAADRNPIPFLFEP